VPWHQIWHQRGSISRSGHRQSDARCGKALYQRDYWDRIGGDRLPASVALLVFDAAINNGTGRAVRWLQQAASVAQDGVIGPATLAPIGSIVAKPDGSAALCAELLAQRLTFMTSLPTWKSFGLGWARRLFRLPYAPIEGQRER
jgi:lysozyme family protein